MITFRKIEMSSFLLFWDYSNTYPSQLSPPAPINPPPCPPPPTWSYSDPSVIPTRAKRSSKVIYSERKVGERDPKVAMVSHPLVFMDVMNVNGRLQISFDGHGKQLTDACDILSGEPSMDICWFSLNHFVWHWLARFIIIQHTIAGTLIGVLITHAVVCACVACVCACKRPRGIVSLLIYPALALIRLCMTNLALCTYVCSLVDYHNWQWWWFWLPWSLVPNAFALQCDYGVTPMASEMTNVFVNAEYMYIIFLDDINYVCRGLDT